MIRTDIIISINNSSDNILKCIDSVIKYTNLKENSITLINNNSNNIPLIKQIIKKHKEINITYINNETNISLINTINNYDSKNDILLLNSNIEVTENWLDKIKSCAYRYSNIATVTPLFNKDINVNIDEYSKYIDTIGYKDYPEIRISNIDCLYIKRELLDIVGYLDESIDDFYNKCLDYGYRHLLCDDTIVYYNDSNDILLNESNNINYIYQNIDIHLNIKNRPNILYLIHEWSDKEQSFGGTSLHTYDLIKTLRHKYNFFILSLSKEGYYILYIYFKDNMTTIKLNHILETGKFQLYNQEYRKMIEKIIDSFGISLIHYEHCLHHYFDVLEIAKKRNIKSMITIHDLYPFCPTIHKLYLNEIYCENIKKDCKKCLNYHYNLKEDIIPNWLNNFKVFLKQQENIFVPSIFIKNEVSKFYNLDSTLIEHGIELDRLNARELSDKNEFNIAFIGIMAPHKGLFLFNKIAHKLKNSNIKVHLFGKLISSEENQDYINHGSYERGELPKLMQENNIDLVCIFSIATETYSYTLTESIASGIPVLAFNLGALEDRITKDNLGWIIDYNSKEADIIKRIKDILNNKKEYNNVIKAINNYKIKTIDDMALEYNYYYEKAFNKRKYNSSMIKDLIYENRHIKASTSSKELDNIINSLRWRIISKIKFPTRVKMIIKSIISYIKR